MTPIRIALAQCNPKVGDIEGNTHLVLKRIEEAKRQDANLIVFPELMLCGYPPEDLLFKPHFIEANQKALKEIAKVTEGIVVVVGYVHYDLDLYNALAVIEDGEIKAHYKKRYLPNYGVFDEKRYFRQGNERLLATLANSRIGFSICEDIWQNEPVEASALDGAEIMININASPYSLTKHESRYEMLKTRARDNRLYIAYVNLFGGQDELVFDGGSSIISPDGTLLAQSPFFEEDLLIYDIDPERSRRLQLKDTRLKIQRAKRDNHAHLHQIQLSTSIMKTTPFPTTTPRKSEPLDAIYRALTLGLKDYITKNGFSKVVIGLSGGIDSALTAAIAVDALGAPNVIGVMMPSQFSSESSISDAKALARNLNIRLECLEVAPTYETLTHSLAPLFEGCSFDVTEENLQARIRGTMLMALSNKFGWIVVSTGNKSEMSVGYSTLYGDMVGGFSLLKDVLKTTVYELCHYRNRDGEVIPNNTITKPPSAELRPDQKDEDSLPPYDTLDRIIRLYVEEDYSANEIIFLGEDPETVSRITRLIDINEYKRRQAPIGVKITDRAFGRDRRMPLTNAFKG